MLATSNFISSADHCRITEYTLEFRLCGKQGCIVCAKIGFGVRMPEISIKGKNILGKLLRWMDLPVIYPLDKAHFLSIDNTRAYIDTKSLSLEEPMSNLPAVKEDEIMKKRLAKGKDKEKGQRFDMSKVRMELICDGCNAHQCLYSNKMVGVKV